MQLPLDPLPSDLEQAFREVVFWSAVNVSVLNLPNDISLVLTTRGLYVLEGGGVRAARVQRIEQPAELTVDREHRRLLIEAPGTRLVLDYDPRREPAALRFADAFKAQDGNDAAQPPGSRVPGRATVDPFASASARAAKPGAGRYRSTTRPGTQSVLGKGFLLAAVIIAAVMYWYHAGPVPSSFRFTESGPIASVDADGLGPREVRVRRDRNGHYLLRGVIDGLPVRFLLDTGATQVAIPAPVAEAAGLSWGRRGRTMTANGEGVAYATIIGTLKIGPITLHGVGASIVPGMTGREVLLGMSALRRLEFSQKGRELVLVQP